MKCVRDLIGLAGGDRIGENENEVAGSAKVENGLKDADVGFNAAEQNSAAMRGSEGVACRVDACGETRLLKGECAGRKGGSERGDSMAEPAHVLLGDDRGQVEE